jgi:hypothetical protein
MTADVSESLILYFDSRPEAVLIRRDPELYARHLKRRWYEREDDALHEGNSERFGDEPEH